jgi:sugar phosphate isomerase/epimerase
MEKRREFLKTAGKLALTAGFSSWLTSCNDLLDEKEALALPAETPEGLFFTLSLAEWSLHKTLWSGKMDHLEFPRIAREKFGITAVEYVSQFFQQRANDTGYLNKMKQRCDDHGVKSVLIMVDAEGNLATPAEKERLKSVENHYKWIDAAHYLGCHAIRVNAFGKGNDSEVGAALTDSLGRLCEYAQKPGLHVIVENHGGYSSKIDWLVKIIKSVGKPNCGLLPDTGNFTISLWPPVYYDPYEGVKMMMPYARGISAKSHEFGRNGEEKRTDFKKILRLAKESGFRGYVGIEYEGYKHSEEAGIKATKSLLIKAAREVA